MSRLEMRAAQQTMKKQRTYSAKGESAVSDINQPMYIPYKAKGKLRQGFCILESAHRIT